VTHYQSHQIRTLELRAYTPETC